MRVVVFAMGFLLMGACSGPQAARRGSTTSAASPSSELDASAPLYDRLGGKEAIAAVVDAFVAKMGADKRVNGLFWNTDIAGLKVLLVEQICEASGGPCKYSGRDMKTAHAGMNLNEGHFAAMVENMSAALNQHHVPAREQKELLGALASMKGDVLHQ
jgi:hemoglobin